MTRTNYVKAMTAAALIGGAMVASPPASAMGVRNCTDIVIKVQIFNNNDALRVIALKQANIGIGDRANMNVGSSRKQIKVFRAQVLDKVLFVKGGLNGNDIYSIRGRNGSYTVSQKNDCQTAGTGGGGGGPVVTIPVDSGKWIGAGRKPITIRTASSTSFTLKQKGRKGKTLYTLVGRDAYRGADGTGFVMTARGQATWGNTPIRRK